MVQEKTKTYTIHSIDYLIAICLDYLLVISHNSHFTDADVVAEHQIAFKQIISEYNVFKKWEMLINSQLFEDAVGEVIDKHYNNSLVTIIPN